MEQPLVTVICACYNQSLFCVESLESVKNQTYKNLEIIIWDDASVDNSVEVIENWIVQNSDLSIRFIKKQNNQGICKCLNEAYSYASGKYLQILALDDILLRDKIQRHVAILENSKKDDALVFSDAYLMDDESNLYQNKFISFHKRYLSINSGSFYADLLEDNFIPANAVFYKKSVLEKIGLWDEELVFEDYDMLLRIAKTHNFIFDDLPSIKYRFHDNNFHKKMVTTMHDSIFKTRLKHINSSVKNNYFLKNYIINKYINNDLQGEQELYYKSFPPRNFHDKWISKNKNQNLYKIAKMISKIKKYYIK